MKHLAPGDRPREKLERRGVAALGDNELVALLIGHGTSGAGALDVANRLLLAIGGTHGLTRASAADLLAIPGVGTALAARLVAAVELGRRTLTRVSVLKRQILRAADAAEILLPDHGAHPVERFGVLLLDTQMRVMRAQIVSTGSLNATVASPRDVFRPAIVASAAAVVLFHNHPSGDPAPSPEDLDITRRLVDAGSLIGVHVLDHLVLADTRWTSIRSLRRW